LKKGLFVVSLALQEVEKIKWQQSIILWGPFKVLKPVLASTPSPVGTAQQKAVRKWYAQLEHDSHIYQVEEGTLKTLQIEEGFINSPDQESPLTPKRSSPVWTPPEKCVVH